MTATPLTNVLNDRGWNNLRFAIQNGDCVPIIGAEACDGRRPLYAKIACQWAQQYDYPFADVDNLARVAQHVANLINPPTAKEEFITLLKANSPTDTYFQGNEPHHLLAGLPLPLYLTTNYDDYMMRALQLRANRKPQSDFCHWYETSEDMGRRKQGKKPTLDRANPMVYYLNGTLEKPASLALTEDDYLDLLANIAGEPELIPTLPIRQALADNNALLFLGYRLTDWDFRVLVRCIAAQMQNNQRRPHVAVQLAPVGDDAPQEQIEKAQSYLDTYFGARYKEVQVFLGTCQDFVKELRTRFPDLYKE